MGGEKEAFFIVQKGNMIGVYKSLSDLQGNDPSLTVWKGYSLSRAAEVYLARHGLKNPMYSLDISDVDFRDVLFGQVVPCPFQGNDPSLSAFEGSSSRAAEEHLSCHGLENAMNSLYISDGNVVQCPFQQPNSMKEKAVFKSVPEKRVQSSCVLEFGGASKGNPGNSGAGAVLYVDDGSMVFRLREGVGWATNNVAEYRGAILGLTFAVQHGFKHIRVQGDSKLVCMQIQELWKTKNRNMLELSKVVKELKDQFVSFQISHIQRDLNSEARAQANLGVYLESGRVQVECWKSSS